MLPALVAVVICAGCAAEKDVQITMSSSSTSARAAMTTTSLDPCRLPDPEKGVCGIPFEDHRDLNLRHADRLDFAGDLEAAYAVAVEVEKRLEALLASGDPLSTETVESGLRELSEFVTVSDEAVRTSGVAFAIEVDGGCVFGDIGQEAFRVDIGGFVRDGGCLALYGH